MSSLPILPIEILEWITSVVTTSQQMRLWQCGDRILNIKLKNGGLKRTSLCWSGCTWMPWPRWYFTTFDGIVDVEWGMDIGRSLCPTLELNLLPKTLKRLHLACEDVFILLKQQNVKMNDMLPLLHSLHLSGRLLCEENLKNLPSDLFELHVASAQHILSSRLFGDLPRRIQSLTLDFSIVDQSELENDLPNELIFLDIHNIECNFNWFSKLPKSLKTLKMTNKRFNLDWLTLPPQLEELVLRSFQFLKKSVLPQLPQSLKTLETLDIRGLASKSELVPLLPKNLTRFLYWGTIDHSGLEQLPAKLTDLDVVVSETHPDILSFFSSDALKIRLAGGPFSDRLNISKFPPTLQFLELEHINDAICAILPPGLKCLHIATGGLITIQGASQLPKSLTSLTACFQMFENDETMLYLRHVSNLELNFTSASHCDCGLTENWISSLVPSAAPSSSDYDLSTRTGIRSISPLTSLIVVGAYGRPNMCPLIKQPFFAALPKLINLKKLKISEIGEIPSSWLGMIPQNVTDLSIRYLETSPTATQLSRLPKCLRILELYMKMREGDQCEWTDQTLQSLPRMLQEFRINLPLPHLTRRMHEYLPPNLQSISLQLNNLEFFTSFDRLYRKEYYLDRLKAVSC